MDNRQEDLLKTLLYADIFNYPLKESEIFNYFIESKIDKNSLSKIIENSNLDKNGEYYCLAKRGDIVKIRKKREKISAKKLSIALGIIKKISKIPSVQLIGISGALSMKNSEEGDDIDIFVITSDSLIWTTRLFLVFYLILLGFYRKRNDKTFKNKICLNMLVCESAMGFNSKNRNIYTAHEIFQMIPVFERDNCYMRFINANRWALDFLPNASLSKTKFVKKQSSFFNTFLIVFLRITQIERISKFLQLKYMQNHMTEEIINDNFLSLHPFDYQNHILSLYEKKALKLGLSTQT